MFWDTLNRNIIYRHIAIEIKVIIVFFRHFLRTYIIQYDVDENKRVHQIVFVRRRRFVVRTSADQTTDVASISVDRLNDATASTSITVILVVVTSTNVLVVTSVVIVELVVVVLMACWNILTYDEQIVWQKL